MRAIRFRRTGGPGVLSLEEVADPVCGAGDVVVRTHAIGVNYADVHFRRGEYLEKPMFPDTPGLECAGEVVVVGEGVSLFGTGDRVLVYSRRGAYAERIAAPAALVYPIPPDLSYEDAASVGVQGLTAMHLLGLAGRLTDGQSVLVHAAAGGVGSLAVQLARRRGCRVVGTAGSLQEHRLRAGRARGSSRGRRPRARDGRRLARLRGEPVLPGAVRQDDRLRGGGRGRERHGPRRAPDEQEPVGRGLLSHPCAARSVALRGAPPGALRPRGAKGPPRRAPRDLAARGRRARPRRAFR